MPGAERRGASGTRGGAAGTGRREPGVGGGGGGFWLGLFALLRRRGGESKLPSGVAQGAQGSGGKSRQLPSGWVLGVVLGFLMVWGFGDFFDMGWGIFFFFFGRGGVFLLLLFLFVCFFNRAQRKTLVHNAEIGDQVAEAGIRKAAVV